MSTVQPLLDQSARFIQMDDRLIPSLPTEILCRICAFASLPDLKRMRLASKLLESCASSFLFQRIYIDTLPGSFEKLLAISDRPNLSWSVRSISCELRLFRSCYSIDRFKPQCREAWDQLHRDRLFRSLFAEGDPQYEDVSEDEWNKHYASHTAMTRLQRKLIQAPTIDVVLFQAFSRFPRLHELFIGDLRYLSTAGHSEAHSLWHAGIMNSTTRNALGREGFEHVPPRARHFAAVLNAAGLAGITPSKICLTHLDQMFFRMSILTYNDPLRICLASVQELRMHINLARHPIDEWLGNLGFFIEQCQSLRDLEITATGAIFMPSRVLQNKNWPSLRTIELGQMFIAEDDLIDFVDRHRTTISAVALHACPLITGEWPSVIIRLQQLFLGYDAVGEHDKVFRLERGPLSFSLLRFHE